MIYLDKIEKMNSTAHLVFGGKKPVGIIFNKNSYSNNKPHKDPISDLYVVCVYTDTIQFLVLLFGNGCVFRKIRSGYPY